MARELIERAVASVEAFGEKGRSFKGNRAIHSGKKKVANTGMAKILDGINIPEDLKNSPLANSRNSPRR